LEEVNIELDYKPRDVFLDFHERSERWAVIVAHRRCGKTVSCINDLIYRALTENKDNATYAYIAPYYSQAKTIAWDYLIKFTEPVRAKHNIAELWVELINGSKIRLFGADNPDNLRGLGLCGVVLDEYADMKPSTWGSVIRPLLADRLGWAVFIGTPKGHNGFWDVYSKATKDNGWYVKTLRADQTDLIAEEELEDARKSMTPDQYEQEFLCSFEAAILGAYYGQEMRALTDSGRITPIEYDPLFPLESAWDLGYSDDTSIWTYQVCHGEVRFLDYHSSNGKSIPFYTAYIAQKEQEYGAKYSTHWLPHDARAKTLASGGKSIIEQLSSKIDIISMKIVPSLSLQDGIQATRMMLLRSWFDPKCEEGIECIRQYQREYDEDKKIFRDKPRHDWASHGSDALRMAAIAWKQETKAAPKDNFIRGISVGHNDATLNDLWASTPRPSIRRI
jgi:hypothetical protein